MKRLQPTLALLLGCALSSQAATLAKWTFETSVPFLNNSATISGIAAEEGTGVASGNHASSDTDWSNPVGNGSAESLSVNTWAVGDYFQFKSSALNAAEISVSFDHISSSTGPGSFNFSYSTDGVTFTPVGLAYSVIANSTPNNWAGGAPILTSSYSYDLSDVDALNGASDIYFRLTMASTTSANGGSVAVTGTSRVDNFSILAAVVPVPEPATGALAALGLGALVLRRSRRA